MLLPPGSRDRGNSLLLQRKSLAIVSTLDDALRIVDQIDTQFPYHFSPLEKAFSKFHGFLKFVENRTQLPFITGHRLICSEFGKQLGAGDKFPVRKLDAREFFLVRK